jgi:D-serine deaminase-like pyridoxal phosphate-dependent protein
LISLLAAMRRHSAIQPIGAMAYEAQVAGLTDRNPFKRLLNPAAALVRRASVRWVRRLRQEIAEAFRASGFELEIFNGGGTGSVDFAAREDSLTEVTAGSALLCSHLFDYYSNIRFESAAYFALQVVRCSDDGYVTCQGGGYIASGQPGWDRVPIPLYPPGIKLVSTEGCGEVQTPLRLGKLFSAKKLQPGDAICFRHAKAGEPAERFAEYHLLRDGNVVGSAKTYRGYGECYY